MMPSCDQKAQASSRVLTLLVLESDLSSKWAFTRLYVGKQWDVVRSCGVVPSAVLDYVSQSSHISMLQFVLAVGVACSLPLKLCGVTHVFIVVLRLACQAPTL